MMKHKVFFLFASLFLIIAVPHTTLAFDFSEVAPSGQFLYYNIVDSHAEVVSPGPGYYNYVTGDLVIPSSVTFNGTSYIVTKLADVNYLGTFENCSRLTSVTIPNNVTVIGDYAFRSCSGLTSVTIPNSVSLIAEAAFRGCTSLTSVTIPNSVTSISGYAFYGCTSLTSVTIPSSVTSIGGSAFYGCTSLTSVTIPNSVTLIGGSAFHNVRHIEYYGNATGSPWGAISMNGVVDGDFVYSDTTRQNLMAYIGTGGAVTIPNNVVTIGAKAFFEYRNLTSVTISNSVTSIGNSAFYGCSSLTSVTIPNSITSIGNDAFCGCSSLTSVVIPNGVTWISNSAFNGCTSLTSVTIPNSVTSIGAYAFYGCINLTSVTIPNSVTSIGDYAFYGCTSLISVSIPSSVTLIGNYAFNGCTSLTSITIPGSVTLIGNSAFNGCISLTSVTIPNSVTSIGEFAFARCDSLTSVTIPSSVTSIGIRAFSSGKYTSVTLGGKNLSVFSNDTTKGRANIILPYNPTTNLWNRTVNVSASAKWGNRFVAWSDGMTANPYSFTITENTTLTAIFTIFQYTLDIQSNNPNYGSVSGGGRYYSGDTVTVSAYPTEHYHFIQWSDNSTENPRWIIITSDLYLTAYFAIDTHTVNVQSNDLARGYVTKSGTEFTYGSSCTVTATAFPGYTFACWSDGTTTNTYTFNVQQDMDLTAVFVAEGGEQLYTVTLQSANPSMGTVSGGGRAIAGSDVVIKAKGKQGYRFVRWNDNNTDSIRTVHVSGNIIYTAYFESILFGIDDVEDTEAKPIIYARDGNIIVRGVQRMDVRVYDMMGRMVAYSTTAEEHDIPMQTAGVYLVKVGTLPARKVVVIR